jgi:hypothetical protein
MTYSAPGKMDELDAGLLAAWNRELSNIFEGQIALAREEADPPSDRAWLYNPIGDTGAEAAEADISWTAFPKRIADESSSQQRAWERADGNRNNQEEYCEWEVARDPEQGNKVVRVTFSCETEDYYRFLAAEAPDLLLELYRRHVSPLVELDDLVVAGRYQPQNRWNFPQSAGARGVLMHMAQRNNAFAAAVNLAAVASWPRVDDGGRPITDEQALIACRPFGDERRHSDPHIGAQINALVRSGNEISLADPVGLYMDSFDTSDWETPDGSPATDCLRVVRGTEAFALRVVAEAPAGADFVLGDVRIAGRRIGFGGQIAETMRIRLRGLARPAAVPAPELTCGGRPAAPAPGPHAGAGLAAPASRRSDTVTILSPE